MTHAARAVPPGYVYHVLNSAEKRGLSSFLFFLFFSLQYTQLGYDPAFAGISLQTVSGKSRHDLRSRADDKNDQPNGGER
jgi:hypothetical protein